MSHETIDRRTALKLTGGSIAAAAMVGASRAVPEATRINVGYANEAGRQAALDAATEVVREFAFDALTVRAPESAVAALERNPGVRYVEPDGRWEALSHQYTEEDHCICAPDAHMCGYCGDGTHVAVLDTGIDSDHPDLEANLGAGTAFVSCTGTECHYAWDDDHGHGTHVAGIAGAVDDGQGVIGVAPCSTLHAAKVLDASGTGYHSDIAAGIQWTADMGIGIANMSFGGSYSSTVKNAVEYAYAHGVLMFAAVGSDSPSCPYYPAAYPEVVAVGGYDCETGTLANSCSSDEVEFIAPSVDVYSTYNDGGYRTRSGTSVAVPFVSGVAALLRAAGYTNREALERMCETACDAGLLSADQGCGVVNAGRAVGCPCDCNEHLLA